MCGIIGVLENDRTDLRAELLPALHTMKSRGPDDIGVWEADGVALGHRRLSIIGVDNGKQPIRSCDGRVTVVVNGEFYGYRKIRQSLMSDYSFQTDSDSEILIPLYLQHGAVGMMKYLRGEFAFLLYDSSEHKLIAGRDRFGIKPLCWYRDVRRIIVASKARAIIASGVEADWDDFSVMQAVTMHYQPTDRTFIKGIRQLCPGHLLICDHCGNVNDIQYWDLNYPIGSNEGVMENEVSLTRQLHDLLYESVKMRTVSDVPVCCHLSGGLDSSAVAGIMADIDRSTPVHCFSIVFPHVNEEYNEEGLAEETVEHIGGVLHKVPISQGDILRYLPEAVKFSEGLAVNGHLSCKYLLNKCIHESGFKVALTGEGADECLCGYPHLRKDMILLQPADRREMLTNRLYDSNLVIRGTEIVEGSTLDCHSIKEQLGFVPSFLSAKASIGYKMYDLLRDDVRDNFMQHDVFRELIERYDIEGRLRGRHIVNQSLYLWIKLTLCNYILGTLGDGCEMAFSVEGRLPFLDHKLFEFAASLPVGLKIKDGYNEKYILKQTMRPYITNSVYQRQKHPFQAPPLTRYFSKEEYSQIVDELQSDAFLTMGFFDITKVKKVLTQIPQMTLVEQTAFEPVIMLMLTMLYFNRTIISK